MSLALHFRNYLVCAQLFKAPVTNLKVFFIQIPKLDEFKKEKKKKTNLDLILAQSGMSQPSLWSLYQSGWLS